MHPHIRETPGAVIAFNKEVKAMRHVPPHPNVVKLLGVCIDPSYPLCIITEFVPGGSLLNLLEDENIQLTLPMVIGFIQDIAAGMHHLHQANILHCDLAARNCLIKKNESNTFKVKIADFGMSKITESGTYAAAKNEKMAIRWSAPEVMTRLEFSKAGDVWSFGILIWEVMQRSEPYYDIVNNSEIISKVAAGYRLPRPTALECPDDIWKLMQSCWTKDPQRRPDFGVVCGYIANVKLEPEFKPNEYTKSPVDKYSTAPLINEYGKSPTIISSYRRSVKINPK